MAEPQTHRALRGLTWDDPRGIGPLAASVGPNAPSGLALDLTWDVQPLSGFEGVALEELGETYDLLVIDHPHLGAALAAGALVPWDEHLGATAIEDLRARSIGRTLDSYVLDGALWALPLDAAAQVAASRPELGDDLPRDWNDVEALSMRRRVGLSLAGPHALATFASLCCALEEPPASGADFISLGVGVAALERLTALARRAPAGTADLDPIAMLRTMAEGGLDYVPLVFGYVGFAGAGPDSLVFSDAPTARGGQVHGSILGGAGLALSRRCPVSPEVVGYARWLVDSQTQRTHVPAHGGQPSARAAWEDATLDAATGGFYRRTRRTLEQAWVRPRHDGYIAFQVEASALLRTALDGRLSAIAAVDRLNRMYRASRAPQLTAQAAAS